MLIQDQINVFQWLLYINIWWAYVGTMSDFGTLFRHSTTKSLPTPATVDSTSLDELSARRRDLYLTTPNPSKREAAGTRLRPLGPWDHKKIVTLYILISAVDKHPLHDLQISRCLCYTLRADCVLFQLES